MPTNPADAWTSLGQLLIQRRVELDRRFKNRRTFCAERDVDYRLVMDIENAHRTNFGRDTLADLEVAYDVKAGAIQAVLDGAETLPPRELRNPFEDAPDLVAAIRNQPNLSPEGQDAMVRLYRAYLNTP